MSFNEYMAEEMALGWFRELGYTVLPGPQLAPGEPAAERESFSDVVLVGRLREAIRHFNPAIPLRALSTLRGMLLPKLLSGELSVANPQARGVITQ